MRNTKNMMKRITICLLSCLLLFGTTERTFAQVDFNDCGFGVAGGYDENGEYIYVSPAVYVATEDEKGVLFVNNSIVTEEAVGYLVQDYEGNHYDIIHTDSDSRFAYFSFEEEIQEEAGAVYVAEAQKNETVTIVYLNQDFSYDQFETTIKELEMTEERLNITLEEIPENIGYVPAIILNENGEGVGVLGSEICMAFLNTQSEEEVVHNEEDNDRSGSDTTKGATDDNDLGGVAVGLIAGGIGLAIAAVVKNKKPKPDNNTKGSNTIPYPNNKTDNSSSTIPYPNDTVDDISPTVPYSDNKVEDIPPTVPYNDTGNEKLYLCIIDGILKGSVFPIDRTDITIGRDTSAVVCFPPDTKGVSRKHCMLLRQN